MTGAVCRERFFFSLREIVLVENFSLFKTSWVKVIFQLGKKGMGLQFSRVLPELENLFGLNIESVFPKFSF